MLKLTAVPDLTKIILGFGYMGIGIAIFSESGFLVGLFLPGDSLLFAAGLLAGQGHLNIFGLIVLCLVAAILGDSFGYTTGRRFGPKIFAREESRFFKKGYIEKTQKFYDRYGAKTIMLARFVPLVRTIAPIMAGVGKMHYPTFLFYNILGSLVWVFGFLSLGYFLGSWLGDLGFWEYVITGVIVILSLVPIYLEWRRNRLTKHPHMVS